MNIKENVRLSDHTTIALGGKAKYFISCRSKKDITDAMNFASEKKLPFEVMSGGSNLVFSDEGFPGVIIKINIKGIEEQIFGDNVFVKIGAGEELDKIILHCVKKGYTGIECLSGIPGSVGATPVQNVGAYGQEISDVLQTVIAVDRNDNSLKTFSNHECRFDYRQSRFKSTDINKFIITEVVLKLPLNKDPVLKYKDLNARIDQNSEFKNDLDLSAKLQLIRNTVIKIRREKSMVIDINDINSRSCGSFFMNPFLNENEFKEFEKICKEKNLSFPFYKSGENFKIPAAWLVENSGFVKGYFKNGVGISSNHSLALININGTTSELVRLSEEIKSSVNSNFGINLHPEPKIL